MWRKFGRHTIKFTEQSADPTALITEVRRSMLFILLPTYDESVHHWKDTQQHSLDKHFHANGSAGS